MIYLVFIDLNRKKRIYHAAQNYFKPANCKNFSAVRFAILICFVFEVCPDRISTADFETPKVFAKSLTSSTFAAPSTGGEAILTRNAPSCSPTISLFDARGTTRTLKTRSPFFSLKLINKFQTRAKPRLAAIESKSKRASPKYQTSRLAGSGAAPEAGSGRLRVARNREMCCGEKRTTTK